MSLVRKCAHLLCLITFTAFGFAQSGPDDPGAGLLPFSTQVGGASESVNIGTSSVFVSIPVRAKIGAIPFKFSLNGNFHPWISQAAIGLTSQWYVSPYLFAGPSGLLGGGLSYSEPASTCNPMYVDFVMVVYGIRDGTGAIHPARATVHSNTNCGHTSATVTATDGSGYTFNISQYENYTIYDRSGNVLSTVVGTTNQVLTSPDGQTITKTWTTSRVGYYTDTLNTTPVSFSLGTAGSPDSYTFVGGDGATQTYKITYATKTLTTAFGCTTPPIVQEVTPRTVYLPVSVQELPTGQTYTLTYEQTPGQSSLYSTGRLTKIIFPSGASVTYGYADPGNLHNGIDCTSGVVPILTRTVDDNKGNVTIYTYVNNRTSASSLYTVTADFPYAHLDSRNNTTVYHFGLSFQTQEQDYQGSTSGTLLKTVATCYNNNFTTCATPPSIPVGVVTQTDAYTSFNTSSNNLVETKFDAYGNTTAINKYDFGASMPPTQTPLSSTAIVYNTGTTCGTLSANIEDRPCSITVTGVTGTGGSGQASQTKYTYNAGGHPTQTQQLKSSGVYLTSSATYGLNGAGAGVLSSTTDVNGVTTNMSNFACNNMFPQTITLPKISSEPFQMSTSQVWDCNGGLMTSTTDVNGHPTTYSYSDPLWRLKTTTRPDLGSTSASYNTGSTLPWSISTTTTTNAGASTTVTNTEDGLSRVVTSNTTDPNHSGGHTVDTVYNNFGQVYTVSNPYFTSGDLTYGITTYTYDALGRVKSQQDPAGSNVNYTYLGRATEAAYYPANVNKQTVTQVDGLGRPIYACEVTNVAQMGAAPYKTPTACGLDITPTPNSGFLTTYAYDALGNLLSASLPGQSARTYTYDGLSRLTSESNPESGSVTYSYDSATYGVGDLSARVRNGVTTNYLHDIFHRVTSTTYSDAITQTVTYQYDGYPNTATNGKSELTYAVVGVSPNQVSGSFSYDTMGRVTANAQIIPGGSYQLNYTYDYLGDILTQSNGTVATYTNTYNALGQMTNINTNYLSSTQSGTLATGFTYNALGQVTYDVLANNLNETFGYDKTGKPNLYTLSGGTYKYGTNTWVGNFLTGSSDNLNGNWTDSYDALGRISAANCTVIPCPYAGAGTASYTYAYDRYGNRWQQNVTGTGRTVLLTLNSNNQVTSNTYDALGNVTNDGSFTYQYDAENRLISVNNGSVATYLYDPFGRRVVTPSFEWLFDLQGHPVSKINISGQTWNASDVYVGGRHWGYTGNNGTLFMHTDWLGTGREWTDLSGTPVATCTSLPFGDGRQCSVSESAGGPGDSFFDSEDGLYHTQFRQLSQAQAHWMSPDPSGLAIVHPSNPQSWNRYAYVTNNPLGLTDPEGLDFNLQCAGDDTDTCQGGLQGTSTNGVFTATQIGNNPDGSGGLIDKTTGSGAYTGTFDGQNVTFSSSDGTQSAGSWIQGSDATGGITGGGSLSNKFDFTFSDHGNGQSINATFKFAGSFYSAEQELRKAGFSLSALDEIANVYEMIEHPNAANFRTPGDSGTGRNSSHALVNIPWSTLDPANSLPTTGNIHVGETNPNLNLWEHLKQVF